MRKLSLFQRELKSVRAGMATIVCVLMLTLLIGACAAENKKQMSNNTNQVSEAGKTENGATSDEQEIVCRMRAVTGSRFKEKVCATKAQWARIEGKNQKNVDDYNRDLELYERPNIGTEPSGIGGQ